ncbi:MAG: helix-turn-helix domain-containing protein [Clostridia bacterium]|nr:helix-turn-helix domain-containing protein [Clostridia bacterium]
MEELCNKLFISPTTAYKLLQSGEIKAFKLGTWKIPLQSVEDYINKKCEW